ncbi:hypothetical protein HC928_04250 [bacterium]|nr:hypothetical protein [bacterium]
MDLRAFFTTLFAEKPYILTVSLVPDAVQFTVTRAEKHLTHHDLLRVNTLPPVLQTFLQQQPPTQSLASYWLPFPLAHQLRQALANSVSATFDLRSQALDDLQIVDCPPDFQIVWHYDATRQMLVRQLPDGVWHLGAGWFTRQDTIWPLAPPLRQHMQLWMSKPELHSEEIGTFLINGLRTYQSPHVRCDLRLETGFAAAVRIIASHKHSLDVQLVSNMPDLQRELQPLVGDPLSLISGTALLPGWHPRLRGRLLDLARSGAVTRLAGDVLLAFLQDDLLPNAEALHVDVAYLKAAFPIYDAIRMPITWQVQHARRHGIGEYWAVPYVGQGKDAIALSTVLKQCNAGMRFVRMGDAWLEYTPAFKEQCARWQEQHAGPLQLAPQEVLGSYRDRLTKLHLMPPQIVIPDAATEPERIRRQIATLRHHGVPVGIIGLQQEVPTLLAEACAQVLQEYSKAAILWLVPRSRHAAAMHALQRAACPMTEAHAPGRVVLATPEMSMNLERTWTLIIFSELDLLMASSELAHVCATLKRCWSISTFARPNWPQQASRAALVLQALGLRASDRDAFVQQCLRIYTDQPDSLLSQLSAPFKQLFTDAVSNTGHAGVPIPPRAPAPTPRPIPHDRAVFRPEFTDSTTSQNATSSFLKQAQHFVNRTGTAAEAIPFKNYWPTYDDMNPQQQAWYFYWRSQVRHGTYPATDLSYLFVHIYEGLHLVGFDTPQQAWTHLQRLWQHYRPLHPKLDTYLIDWLADFLIVHRLPQSPLDWYCTAMVQGGQMRDQNLVVEAWLASSLAIDQIPAEILQLLSPYNPTRSKFYQQYNADGTIASAYRRGLAMIDAAVRNAHGHTLFEHYRPARTHIVRRQPFASAVYEGERTEIQIATVACWADAEELKTTIASILKYTENRLRRQHQFKSMLKGIALPPEWIQLLDAAFPDHEPARTPRPKQPAYAAAPPSAALPAPPTQPITIDYTKVNTLVEESDAVRIRLIVEEDPAPAIPTAVPQGVSQGTAASDRVTGAMPTFNLERPENTPEHLLTDLHAVAAVLGNDTDALTLLRFCHTQGWQADSEQVAQTLAGTFLAVVLDRLNERALDELGDQLVFVEGSMLVVAEDYRDELEHLFTASIPVSVAKPPLNAASAYADLAPEWAAFVQQMQPYHWETLSALLTGVDVSVRLAGIAQSVQRTADLLIEEINEYALVHIGDIIIAAGDHPMIEDEDYASVHELVAWAIHHEGVIA